MRDELPQFAAVGASVLFCEMEIIRVIVCQTRFHVLYTHQVFILTIVAAHNPLHFAAEETEAQGLVACLRPCSREGDN